MTSNSTNPGIDNALVEKCARAICGRELEWQDCERACITAGKCVGKVSESLIEDARSCLTASGYAEMKRALVEARRLCDQVKIDLSSAHAEICKLQKLDAATHAWPDWTPQANTLRWLDAQLIPQIDAALQQQQKA